MEDRSTPQPYNTLTLEDRVKRRWHAFRISPIAFGIYMIALFFPWILTGFHLPEKYSESTDQKPTLLSLVGSMIPLGAVLGTLPVGILADLCGRKVTACFSVLPMIISAFVMGWTKQGVWDYVMRFFAGIGCGASSVVLPIYFYEITDEYIRQKIARIIHMCINSGIIITYTINYIHSASKATVTTYQMLIGCCVLFIIAVPESPTWLLARGRKEEAERVIRKLTGKDVELETIEPEKLIGNAGYRGDTFKLMSNKKKDVALILGLIVFQQISGIGALTVYSMNNFVTLVSVDSVLHVLIVTCLVTIAVPWFNVPLINFLGKKRLLVISTILMTVTSFSLALFYYLLGSADIEPRFGYIPIISLLIYLFAFNIGSLPVPWIMIGKMFPNSTRKLMYNLALTCAWATIFITTFLDFLDHVDIFILFLIYGFINLLGAILVIFAVPKTINKVDEEVPDDLDKMNMNLTSISPPDNV